MWNVRLVNDTQDEWEHFTTLDTMTHVAMSISMAFPLP